jgi:excisionase family DNA binding protein
MQPRRSQAKSSTGEQAGAGAEQQQLTSVEEASRRLAVSTFTTRRLIKAKQIRAVRVGKRVLIPESEIARVILHGAGSHASAE